MSRNRPARPALLPLSLIFGGIVRLRNYMYDRGVCRISSFDTPSICIGNISVGGTGKTPHTEYLVRLLQKEHKVAVLSRGYKRKTKGFVLSATHSSLHEVGDEALQIAQKFPEITVAVHENRVKGMQQLLKVRPEIEVVLLDDAFQHRRLKAGLSIVLLDYGRPVHKDYLLPAGNLREKPTSLSRAEILICSKCPPDISKKEMDGIRAKIQPTQGQTLFFSAIRYGKLRASFPDRGIHSAQSSPEELWNKEVQVLCFCGIASPASFLKQVRQYFPEAPGLVFPDHHEYTTKDVASIQQAYDKLTHNNKCIITTQKDHMHIKNNPIFEALTPYIYYIEIDIHFLNGQEEAFNEQIIQYVRHYSTKSSMA